MNFQKKLRLRIRLYREFLPYTDDILYYQICNVKGFVTYDEITRVTGMRLIWLMMSIGIRDQITVREIPLLDMLRLEPEDDYIDGIWNASNEYCHLINLYCGRKIYHHPYYHGILVIPKIPFKMIF